MYEALALICVGLTIGAFVLKNGALLIATGLAWVGWGVLMVNVGTGVGEPFEGNVFLPQFFLALGGIMALVCIISAVTMYMRSIPPKLTLDDEQRTYRQKVLKVTKRR